MTRLLTLLCIALALPAAERWVEFRSGPFEVLTDAGERAGRGRLAQFEQLRYAVEQVLGQAELRPGRPIRILVLRSAKEAAAAAPASGLVLAGDAITGAAAAEGPLSRSLLRACAQLLIESGPGRLPAEMESGLADLFSTLELTSTRIILGAPLPAQDRNRDWAKMHMLTVPPEYYGKLPVLVGNLWRGVEAGPAYRNAFGKSPAEIDEEAEAYFGAGNYATTPLRGRTMFPEREFAAKPVDPSQARSAYEAIRSGSPASTEALERLGLITSRERRPTDAQALAAAEVAAEKKRRAEEEQREIEKVKEKAIASIQAALAKGQSEQPASPSSGKAVPWWDGPQPEGKVQGLLRQVDCLGQQARLVIEGQDKKLTRLLIRDPKQLAVVGGGDVTFGCGPQKPPRRVVVEYFPKPDAKLGTVGEAAVIEFP
jgi:hypothetical protein